ncbi:hypothetical protein E2C01_087921 [Portunus trituberculatus]|uniref:Uncharacterized protein n=1 Tax=Portunus trituberculatus TaxID=210409 RepID=A0A5B7J9E5_PORTR|nr:hypothetical protein [Portunus trituberculatus]
METGCVVRERRTELAWLMWCCVLRLKEEKEELEKERVKGGGRGGTGASSTTRRRALREQGIIANEGDVEEMRQFRWRVITTSVLRDGMTELHHSDRGRAIHTHVPRLKEDQRYSLKHPQSFIH